ncbi:hypothetical protein DY218_20805 [Streptomyces triticagri]|uniref:Uncharacterized protein n=1 Tax=Streptomyces triticagri TaxID=2293568 RepID=A0A372M1F3_9ACTN|nr:hypothetical protein DY218_20805 [Streptomyces triticagri]
MPSGSASTAQPVPSGLRRSSRKVAPSDSRRSTSSSRVVSGRRHRCSRFLPAFASGTSLKCSAGPPGSSSTSVSSSPGRSSASIGRPVTRLQNSASR